MEIQLFPVVLCFVCQYKHCYYKNVIIQDREVEGQDLSGDKKAKKGIVQRNVLWENRLDLGAV